MDINGDRSSIRHRFSQAEDLLLKNLVEEANGVVNWKDIASKMGTRSARQCRERYKNYLKPTIIKKNWTKDEDALILQKYQELGNKWESIARFLKGRSGSDTRNRYLSLIRVKKNKKSRNSSYQSKSSVVHQPQQPIIKANEQLAPQIDFDKLFFDRTSIFCTGNMNDHDVCC
ncbi:Myb-like DNA-binding domain containing protein [Trichomonas vaginalis G3]|uniref:Myb-like DNA-binding domain containing protein n=1 Tax=Trichomonas vaginalis (strain ATCC PRA-98 / G3) TaxID=412133 RepID=A2FYF6_TRIV3|nr:RNA polymerase II transcription regulator recruiting protein [Trichomonas vaginalis G3]EAX90073.1 Myb-like DNA-binding domain containing protein [Trichomonas vaginalis G3]KAI5515526.1 RNA polymerase II transcription regulator recruiting protein [Trichomonas vaginalis G3]|eukprot:XP_001303003.1 Myb-like DNA-binding domain containing protein [Trichomonas vaginalis G3]